jgi:quercetin dioxygenase-like cupin family protein
MATSSRLRENDMYGVKVNEGDIEWTPLEMPGVSMKVLYKDEATGAMAVLTRMDAGATIPAHFHTKADETVYVLAGDFVEDGESHGAGAYFVGKAGVPHGPHQTVGGCTVLTQFSAELDFQLVQAGP